MAHRIGGGRQSLRIERSEAERLVDHEIEKGQALLDEASTIATDAQYEDWRHRQSRWRSYVAEVLLQVFEGKGPSEEFNSAYAFVVGGGLSQDVDHLSSRLNDLISIRERMDLAAEAVVASNELAADAIAISGESRVFVVHGHNESVEEAVVAQLRTAGDYEVIVLRDEPGGGRTIIEKFEAYGETSSVSVVLLTADDVGAARDEARTKDDLRLRARQNVILELGYFIGRLGRGHVVALYEEGVEIPSDYAGVEYVPLAGNWRYRLLRELNHAGFTYDLSKVRRA